MVIFGTGQVPVFKEYFMNRFIDFKSEDNKNRLFSVKKYIAAGSAAAFVLCAVIGACAADMDSIAAEDSYAESISAEANSTSDETVFISRDLDCFAAFSGKKTVNVSPAAYSKENVSSDCEGVNTADGLNNRSFISDEGTRANVNISSARSSEKYGIRVVEPEMSPYRDGEYDMYFETQVYNEDTRVPDEDENEGENEIDTVDENESGTENNESDEAEDFDEGMICDGEEIFADDESGSDETEGISKFEIPDWLRLDENGIPLEYDKAIEGKSCAYTAEPDALMSTGKEVFQGYVAVDPDIIPYGSELYIIAEDGEVYGYAIAADTGYSVREGHIIVDLFMDEYDDCIQWGKKNVTVFILRTGEDE